MFLRDPPINTLPFLFKQCLANSGFSQSQSGERGTSCGFSSQFGGTWNNLSVCVRQRQTPPARPMPLLRWFLRPTLSTCLVCCRPGGRLPGLVAAGAAQYLLVLFPAAGLQAALLGSVSGRGLASQSGAVSFVGGGLVAPPRGGWRPLGPRVRFTSRAVSRGVPACLDFLAQFEEKEKN